MIFGIGIDIVEKKRISDVIYKRRNAFIKRILSKEEQDNLPLKKNEVKLLSKLFAAKEALTKAFGTGFINGISFNKITIKKNSLNKPFVNINKSDMDIKLLLTLSHEKKNTIAFVMIIKLDKFN